eukprot:1587965-Prymnesium_polylepis.4
MCGCARGGWGTCHKSARASQDQAESVRIECLAVGTGGTGCASLRAGEAGRGRVPRRSCAIAACVLMPTQELYFRAHLVCGNGFKVWKPPVLAGV